MTYREFKDSEFAELMPNGYELINYDTDEELTGGSRYDDWMIVCIAGSSSDFIPAIYISEN